MPRRFGFHPLVFAALVFPGGSGMGQMSSLGSLGQKVVVDFIRRGGHGAVGLCAGCYRLSDTPDYPCFHLGGMAAIERDPAARTVLQRCARSLSGITQGR